MVAEKSTFKRVSSFVLAWLFLDLERFKPVIDGFYTIISRGDV